MSIIKKLPTKADKYGPLAQLVARFDGIEEVTGSNPVRSTSCPCSSMDRTVAS